MAEYRPALHAYLSRPAHDGITIFATENGVSATALLEALGLEIAAEIEAGADPVEVRQDWVKAARKIDAARRRRGGDR